MTAYRLFIEDLRESIGWRLVVLVVVMALVGFAEGLSIALLLPLLSRLGIAAGAGSGDFAAMLERMLAFLAPTPGAGVILAVLIGVAAIQTALFLGMSWAVAATTRRYEAEWQIRMFRAFILARWSFLNGHMAGALTNAIVTEANRLAGAFLTFAQLLAAIIIALIYLAFAFLISVKVTLCLIVLAGAMALSISRFYRTSFRIGSTIGPENERLQVLVGENLANAKIVKTMVNEARALDRVERVIRSLQHAKQIGNFLPYVVRGVFEFSAFCSLAGLFVFGAQVLDVTPANVLVVLALFLRLMPRLTSLQTHAHNLNSYVPAIVHVRELTASAEAQVERPLEDVPPLVVLTPTSLEVAGLSVAYGETEVLSKVDMSIPIPGMVGIVGESGAGKSTLVHALIGLVSPVRGSIRIGPHDLATSALAAWRGTIGYVPQETILFNASVRDNLIFGRPKITEEELATVARQALAHDFIMSLPAGYDTPIGDRGVLLSGGQRQRLGIARALLLRPLILMMDEPTSSLDSSSEAELLKTIDELRKTIGVIIVAHRLASVRTADRIYVLDRGRLAESGHWDDLMGARTRLHALAQAQQLVI